MIVIVLLENFQWKYWTLRVMSSVCLFVCFTFFLLCLLIVIRANRERKDIKDALVEKEYHVQFYTTATLFQIFFLNFFIQITSMTWTFISIFAWNQSVHNELCPVTGILSIGHVINSNATMHGARTLFNREYC